MRIENLNIRYFGRKSNLFLDQLSSRVNVVYGPNGSGKSTAIQFIRWMLFGNCDSQCERYVRETVGRAEGAMTVFHDGLDRSFARQDDGSRYGQVSVDGSDRFAQQTQHMVSLLGEINLTDFDQLYAPKFEDEPDIYGLLRNAQARGMTLTGQRTSHPRVPELRLKIDNLRRDMDRLPWRANDLHSLVEQQESLESRISMQEDEYRRRRLDYDSEYQEINRQIHDLEIEINRIREQWHVKDDQVAARRRELETAWRAAEEAKQEYLRQRREELASIEANIGRARAMLGEVRNRYERVDTDLRTLDLEAATSTPNDTTACLVDSIATQLDQMRSTPQSAYDPATGCYRPATSRDDDIGATPIHGTASLDALRGDVGKLCRTLQENQSGQRTTQLSQELLQLQQCDAGMENWLATMTKQRDQIAAELDRAQRRGVSLVADTATGDVWNHHGMIMGEIARPEYVKAVPHACDAYEPIEPESDVLLRRLIGERDSLNRELEAAERRLRQLLDRRRELETAVGRVSDQELEATKRDLLEIESLIRSATEREQMLRDIERLEDELRRLQDGFQQSSVVQQACETLRRLSLNRLVALTIDGMGGVSVEDDAGRMIPFGQLGRGVRDQVYLSLVLALVSAYRARGVELPLVLNDVFSHIDSERDDATAAVLNDFARQGHQIILFTRHRHVAQLFEPYQVRYLELISSTPVVHEEPSVVEAVRFRSRDEDPTTIRTVRAARRTNRERYDEHPTTARTVSPIRPTSKSKYEPAIQRTPIHPVGDATRPRQRPVRSVEAADYLDVTLTNSQADIAAAASGSVYPAARPTPPPPRTPVVDEPPLHPLPVTPPQPASYALSRSTTLEETGIIDADVISRLRAMSVVTIDDFLQASPSNIDRELQSWGLSTRPIRRWQDELVLRCNIPGLTANEARLLVAAGVADLQTLADCEADTLAHRLTTLLASRAGRGAPNLHIDLAKVATWVTTARRRAAAYRRATPTQWSTRSSYSEAHTESQTLHRLHDNDEWDYEEGGGDDRGDGLDADGRSRFEDTGILGGSSNLESPSRRSSGRSSSTARSDASARSHRSSSGGTGRGTSSGSSSTKERKSSAGSGSRSSAGRRGSRAGAAGELKFHLERTAAVVDAPSIGARTAERLLKIGIHTVEDLLSIDPDTAAANINYRRITADTIRQWQSQSILCCRIPSLRGHDAQILVACGITDPDKMAQMDAAMLWGIVQPFTKTAQCKRIVRNGHMPDPEEIQQWINRATSSRALNTA